MVLIVICRVMLWKIALKFEEMFEIVNKFDIQYIQDSIFYFCNKLSPIGDYVSKLQFLILMSVIVIISLCKVVLIVKRQFNGNEEDLDSLTDSYSYLSLSDSSSDYLSDASSNSSVWNGEFKQPSLPNSLKRITWNRFDQRELMDYFEKVAMIKKITMKLGNDPMNYFEKEAMIKKMTMKKSVNESINQFEREAIKRNAKKERDEIKEYHKEKKKQCK